MRILASKRLSAIFEVNKVNYPCFKLARLAARRQGGSITAFKSMGFDVRMYAEDKLPPSAKRIIIDLLAANFGAYLNGKGQEVTFTFKSKQGANRFIDVANAKLGEFGAFFSY